MTHSWPSVLLTDICNPKQWPTISQSDLTPSGYPVYGANGKIGCYSEFNHESPTLLVTCRGATCGSLNICEPFSYVTGNSMALDDLDEKRADQKYLYYALLSRGFKDSITGTAQPQITRQSLSPVSVPLPPLPEQKRIAAILDKADSIRRKRQESVQLTEELLRSVFLNMFGDPVTNPKGWETLRMEEIILDGPQNGLYKHESDYGSGTQIVRIDSFYDGEVTGIDKLKRVRLDDGTIQKYLLQEEDLLINRVNSRKFLGKSAIVPKLEEPTVFESNIMRIAVNKKMVCPHYLVSLLQHQYIKTQIDNKAKDAVNQSSINQDDVKSFELRIPPLELQSEFKDIKQKIYGLFLRQNEAVEHENTLFNSLLQRAFEEKLNNELCSINMAITYRHGSTLIYFRSTNKENKNEMHWNKM